MKQCIAPLPTTLRKAWVDARHIAGGPSAWKAIKGRAKLFDAR